MIALLRRLTLASAFMIAAISAAGAQSSDDLFKGFQSGSNDPINVEADSLDVVEKDGERQSTFSGNVTVTRGDTVLKAAKIVIYSAATGNPAGAASEAPGGGDFTRIVASGKVYVNSKDQTATGDTGSVDLRTRIITLDGNVTLSQGKNVITGDRLVFDMNTGRARVEQATGGRIRGIFTPRGGNDGR